MDPQMNALAHTILGEPKEKSIIPYIRVVEVKALPRLNLSDRLRATARFADRIRNYCIRSGLPAPSVHVNFGQCGLDLQNPLCTLLAPVNDIVTHAKLINVTFFRRNYILASLSSLPRLQYLELSDIQFGSFPGSDFPDRELFRGVPLSTLRISTANMGFIISTLVKVAGHLSHLDDFGITYQDIRQQELPLLAGAIQRSVRCLRFSACCYPGDLRNTETRPSAFDIGEKMSALKTGKLMVWVLTGIPEFVGRFRSLTTLTLDNLKVDGSDPCSGRRHRHRSGVSFEWVTGVLQQLSSPIRKLVFEVTATDISQLDAIPWKSVDSIINPEYPQFRDLVRVKVLVKHGIRPEGYPSSIGKDAVLSEVTRRLPALNLLGLLRCDTSGC